MGGRAPGALAAPRRRGRGEGRFLRHGFLALAGESEHADREERDDLDDQAEATGRVVSADGQLAPARRQREPLGPSVDRRWQGRQRVAVERGRPAAVRFREH
jgi:hypothetical protein